MNRNVIGTGIELSTGIGNWIWIEIGNGIGIGYITSIGNSNRN